MQQVHIDTLKKFETEIIAQVHVDNGIINPLLIQHILKPEDVQAILNGKSNEEKTSKLLDVLPRCGPFAFEEFKNALKDHYNWLSDKMERHLENHGMSHPNANYTDDIPPCPTITVTRKELTLKLKTLLNKLKPYKHLAVHGLPGIGKSCAIRMALDDTHLVADLFKNEIYWVEFKEIKNQNLVDEILNQLHALHQKITKGDHATRLPTESLKDCFIRLITAHFKRREHQNSLIILDKVSDKEIIDTFDFGCKTLVITDDLTIVKEKEPLILEISSGFTEDESLTLFGKFLNITVEKLPPEAKKIHELCEGFPILIKMIAAEFHDFKEKMAKDPTWWQNYFKKLEKRDPEYNVIQTTTRTFDFCIDKLKSGQKRRYYELAIFNDDVNIMPKTLEILWGTDALNVGKFMLDFYNKSLATIKWNDKLNCYVYGVHNLLLNHLRIKLGPEVLKAKHQSLIEKYKNECNNNFSKLPLDNYIYSYIGHHLEKAEFHELSEQIYLDLKFIQAKIIHAGLNDLLIDLKKYKQYIIKNCPENLSKIADLEKFLRDNRSILTQHKTRNCLDIIQIALNHGEKGFVMDQAQKIAIEESANPYFSRIKILEHESADNIFTDKCSDDSFSENISTICFTDEQHSLLWATENGNIVNKNLSTGQTSYVCGVQKEIIKKLLVSNLGNYFLVLTEKGIAKLFRLERNEDNAEKNDQSPREKQIHYTDLFNKMENKDDSLHTYYVNNECISDVAFSADDQFIGASTEEGTLILWGKTEEICRVKLSNNVRLKKVLVSTDQYQNILVHSFSENCVLSTYKFNDRHLDYITMYNPQISNGNEKLDLIFCRALINERNSLILVTNKTAVHIQWLQSDDQIYNIMIKGQTTINDQEKVFVSATVTYDEQYLITAKSDGYIEIWNIHKAFELVASYYCKISNLDTYWMKNEKYHLLCGKENSLIYRWKLNPKIEEQKPLSKPLFDVLMKPKGQGDMVVKRTTDNKIIITQGSQSSWRKKAEINLEGTVSTIMLSKDGKKLIYDIIKNQRQEIFLFDIEEGTSQHIMQLEKVSNFIKLISNFLTTDLAVIVEDKKNLKVWFQREKNKAIAYLVPNNSDVIGIHEMDENKILTVSRNCNISYWDVNNYDWQLLFVEDQACENTKAISSTLSPNKSYLGVLTENRKDIVLYIVTKNLKVNPIQVTINLYHKIAQLNDKVNCLEFSKNEKYLSIGFKNGNISIFDMEEKIEIYMLSFHSSCVENLIWNSSSELLSVNSEEAARWKISPKNIQLPLRKISRMGMCNNSENSELEEHCSQQHMVKKNESLLLRIVPLSTCTKKVCVSEDFEKFLTVDDNGYINIFTSLKISDLQTSFKSLPERCSMI